MLNYTDCKNKISKLGIKKAKSFSEKIKQMRMGDKSYYDVPLAADIFYRNNGWVSWAEFLGTNLTRNTYIKKYSLDYLRKIAHELKFTSNTQWKKYAKENNYPVKTNIMYKNHGWLSWADFLGHIIQHKPSYISYEDAMEYLISFKFKTIAEYQQHIRENLITNIPLYPRKVYKEWLSWDMYLGRDAHTSNSSAIITIENFLMLNNIVYVREKRFENFVKYPFDIYIPCINLVIEYDGIQHYKDTKGYFYDLENIKNRDGMKNNWCFQNKINLERIKYDIKDLESHVNDILTKYGLIINTNKEYYNFDECKEYIRNLKINNMCKWYELFRTGKIDNKIPFRPYNVYKDNWISWENFFSSEIIQNTRFLSFEDAKKYLRDNNINDMKSWKELLKDKPSFIPTHPRKMYKNQYIDMNDWLGFMS